MHPLLQIVNAKFNWGTKHLDTLNDEVRAWIESKPFTLVSEHNAEQTDYAISLRFDKRPEFIRWGLMAGDVLFNLRSTLDHLVYALAVSKAGIEPPPSADDLMYPITDSPSKFSGARNRGLLTGLSDEAITFIEDTQPYEGRDQTLTHLRDLNDRDKHRLLQVSALYIKDSNTSIFPTPVPSGGDIWFHDGPLEEKTEILRIAFTEPYADMRVELDLTLIVAFWEETERGKSATDVLADIQREVHRIIKELRGS